MAERESGIISKWFSPERILIYVLAWFILPFVIAGKFSYVFTADNLEILVSHLMALADHGLDLPAWAPYSTAGTDVPSMGFTGFANVILFSIFPGWLALQINVAVQFAGAVLGSYFLCRHSLGLGKAASLLPGMIIGLNLTGQMYLSTLALQPLFLFSLTKLLDYPRNIGAWVLCLAVLFWISGTSYISWLFPFSSLLVIGWFLIIDTRKRPWEWAIIALMALVLVAPRADDLIALAQIAPVSHIKLLRPLPTVADIFSAWGLIATNIDKLCALLFILSLVVTKPRPPKMGRVAVFLLIGLLVEPAAMTLQVFFADGLPFLQGFNVFRVSFFFKIVLWMSSAYFAAMLVAGIQKHGRQRALSRGAQALVGISLIYFAAEKADRQIRDWLSNGNYVHNLESPELKRLAAEIPRTPWPERAELFQVQPTYLHPYGIETASGYQALYPRRYYEFWSTVIEPWGKSEANSSTAVMAQDWPFYRITRLNLTTNSHAPDRRFGDLYRLNLLSMANVGWIISRDRLTDEGLELVRGGEKPWSANSRLEKIKINLAANFKGRKNLYIYRNKHMLPRFISPSKVRIFKDAQGTLAAMGGADMAALANTLFAAVGDLPPGLDPGRSYGPLFIRPVSYRPDRIELIAEGDGDCILVGFNSWSPFWSVTIDGRPAELFPANHAFWGVMVSKGRHKISFRYELPGSVLD